MKLTKWAAVALAAAATGGCAACPTCRGDATATASPQTPAPGVPGWQAVPRHEPQPAPPVPRHDFTNPPTDEGDTPPSPPPPGPAPPPAPVVPAPAPPAPVTPAPPALNGRAKTTLTRETEGSSVIIDQSAPGTVIVNSPGVATPAAAPGQGYQPAQSLPVVPIVTAVASSPEVVSLLGAAVRRTGGALYYLGTGRCPAKTVAAAPASYVQAIPAQYVQAAPVQYVQPVMAAPVQMVQQAPQMLVMPAAVPVQAVPQYLPAAAPSFAVAAPAAPKKCRFFGP